MSRNINILTIVTLTILLASYSIAEKSPVLFSIPTQTLNLFKILGDDTRGKDQTINKFQISELVTFKDYKYYLKEIKKDSSDHYYQTQLPDSNIGSTAVRDQYLTSAEYDDFPVLGISWDNAMNYCKWKTLMENKDSIEFIYRLPDYSEWLAAYSYLAESKIRHDLNKNYSDWLLNSKDESFFDFTNTTENEWAAFYIYFHKKDDPRVLKRKLVIGDSYLYHQDKLINYQAFSYYSFEGYRQVSFRYVKEPVNQFEDLSSKSESRAARVLAYWGLKTK